MRAWCPWYLHRASDLIHTLLLFYSFLCYALGALFTFPLHSLSLLVLSRTHSLAILSPYSSYCACGHSPWVFALPGLILLLPVISFCLLRIDASCAAALLSFVLGQRLLLTLSLSWQCRLLTFFSLHFQICSPLFVFLLSPACTQIYPLTPPPSPGDGASYIRMRASFGIFGEFLHHFMVC